MQCICVIGGYPSPARPTAMAFVREIAHGFARAGKDVVVVSPVPFPRCLDRQGYPFSKEEGRYASGGRVVVFRPATVSFSTLIRRPWMGPLNPTRLSAAFDEFAIRRTLKRQCVCPDVFYGHFIGNGIVASHVARRFDKPVFAGIGESSFSFVKDVGLNYYRREARKINAFVPNASHFVPVLRELFAISEDRQHVFPNGIDSTLFYPRDKISARVKYKIPEGAFVVGSTGHFIYRKGINRVAEAIRDLDDVCGIFAGRGGLPPVGSNVLFRKPVRHEELPEFLSACDVFVLPTLSEGCCNAIAEAMACGLPVISSNNIYVDDQLDETCSIRVDPLNVQALREAICELKINCEKRNRLAAGALERAKLFDINLRIRKMLALFFEE